MSHFFGIFDCVFNFIFGTFLWGVVLPTIAICTILTILRIFLRWRTKQAHGSLWQSHHAQKKTVVVGFFHPYCNAGGGGERVLWCGIRSLQRRYGFVNCVVYTGDCEFSPEQIMSRAKERFNINLERPITFVFLRKRRWVEAEMWPLFTLLGQSIGSMLLGFEALLNFVPDVYIDTMGYAFTYPLFRFIGGCKVGCYVHYPTISTDMLMKVKTRVSTYNNSAAISRSIVLTQAKLTYYKLFAFLYGLVGKCSSVIMVNSSWTKDHVVEIWNKPASTSIVYPPCDTSEFAKLENASAKLPVRKIISIGQFRPEKNHALQIKSFKMFLESQGDKGKKHFQLLLVGSCRNEDDDKRVADLKKLCEKLNISNYVEFHLNIPFSQLKELLSQSTIGIHTMWNEHFGIGIVEFMAAGVIALAHDSGGPKLDIVCKWKGMETGYRASDEDSYYKAMNTIFSMSEREIEKMRQAARESVQKKFSEEIFENEFIKYVKVMIT